MGCLLPRLDGRESVQAGGGLELVKKTPAGREPSLLGHVSEVAAVGGAGGSSVPANFAPEWPEDPHDRPQGGRLAGAVAPHQADYLARLHPQSHPLDRQPLAVAVMEVDDLESWQQSVSFMSRSRAQVGATRRRAPPAVRPRLGGASAARPSRAGRNEAPVVAVPREKGGSAHARR